MSKITKVLWWIVWFIMVLSLAAVIVSTIINHVTYEPDPMACDTQGILEFSRAMIIFGYIFTCSVPAFLGLSTVRIIGYIYKKLRRK